jgi:hypothetical protein
MGQFSEKSFRQEVQRRKRTQNHSHGLELIELFFNSDLMRNGHAVLGGNPAK